MNARHAHSLRSSIRRLPVLLSLILLPALLVPGCRADKPALGKAALSLRDGLQEKLDLYSAAVAEPLSQGDRKRVKSALEKLFSDDTGVAAIPAISVAVLDNHGASVATTAQTELSAVQNFGNYHVVARALHKRETLQSVLYLQGGNKVFIVCAPLLYRNKLAGIMIIGIDDDHLYQAGISDEEFFSFSLASHPGTP